MTEQEYILAKQLAYLDIAVEAISQAVNLDPTGELQLVYRDAYEARSEVLSKINIEVEE